MFQREKKFIYGQEVIFKMKKLDLLTPLNALRMMEMIVMIDIKWKGLNL